VGNGAFIYTFNADRSFVSAWNMWQGYFTMNIYNHCYIS
jgi:hypothetical protein